jgi:hypothetical protein
MEEKENTKELSDADLGLATASHQTHIGFSEAMVTGWEQGAKVFRKSLLFVEGAADPIACDATISPIAAPGGGFNCATLAQCTANIQYPDAVD